MSHETISQTLKNIMKLFRIPCPLQSREERGDKYYLYFIVPKHIPENSG